MNARTLAAVAIRIAAVIMLASVPASVPMAAYTVVLRDISGVPASALYVARMQAVVNLVFRVVVIVLLFQAGNRIARWIEPEPLGPRAVEEGMGISSVTAIGFALIGLLFLVEGIETLAGSLYLFAAQPRGLFGAPSMENVWRRHEGEAIARSALTIVAAGAILCRDRLARLVASLRRR